MEVFENFLKVKQLQSNLEMLD